MRDFSTFPRSKVVLKHKPPPNFLLNLLSLPTTPLITIVSPLQPTIMRRSLQIISQKRSLYFCGQKTPPVQATQDTSSENEYASSDDSKRQHEVDIAQRAISESERDLWQTNLWRDQEEEKQPSEGHGPTEKRGDSACEQKRGGAEVEVSVDAEKEDQGLSTTGSIQLALERRD